MSIVAYHEATSQYITIDVINKYNLVMERRDYLKYLANDKKVKFFEDSLDI